ncbi:MAG TPA: SDR family oxidoreductase [Solirubrobacteraceae bacterium]|nr:SDR family oxidoreductase [Solirubrobacteraceae bacterium]
MRALVTGGAGFIGSHLVDRLLDIGLDVRVLDNFSTGHRSNLAAVAEDVEVIEGDVQSLDRVRRAVRGCDLVLHQAALPSVPRSIVDPLTSHACNVTGTLNMLLAARDANVERVLFASSSSVYGSTNELPKHESMVPLPISPYGVAKLAAERYCHSFYITYGMETVSLRYFNVFGPRQDPLSEYSAVIPTFIARYCDGQPPTINGDGEQSRDFTWIGNVVDANIAALDARDVAGCVYNIACGEGVTLNRLATELREQTGAQVEPVHGPPRFGEVRHSVADVTSAREQLGYAPSISLSEGLRATVAAYVDSPAPAFAAVSP